MGGKHKGAYNDEGYCPICGKRYEAQYGVGHRCNEASLRAIDAAMKRNPDEEEPRRKSEGRRLYDGLSGEWRG